jgi:hypothetical protein
MLLQDNGGAMTPTKRLWAMANFSRYIHPGAVRIGATSGNGNLLVSAYQNIDGSVAVVALNQSSSTMWPTFRLQNVGNAVNGSQTPVLTDNFNNVAPQPATVVENGLSSSQVPPRALVTFVLTPGTPPAAGRFIDQLSGMCLGVPSGSQTPGVNLVQYFCNGSADQNWTRDVNSGIASAGRTYYRWVDQISGLCLGVTAGSTTPGASVMQWPCYNAADQYWAKIGALGGYTQMINLSSGLCLGVKSGSRSANAPIITWNCNGSGDQNWLFTGQ